MDGAVREKGREEPNDVLKLGFWNLKGYKSK